MSAPETTIPLSESEIRDIYAQRPEMTRDDAILALASLINGSMATLTTRDKVGLKGRGRIVQAPCALCGALRWVSPWKAPALCGKCLASIRQPFGAFARKPGTQKREKSHAWKGGRREEGKGYVLILLPVDHPFVCMAHKGNGTVMEHRLVMAEYLGRPLLPTETVHHRNGVRDDNRIENLELWIGNHGAGIRASDHHCPGCMCFESEGENYVN